MKKIIIVENCTSCPYYYITKNDDWRCWNVENSICSEDPVIKSAWKIPEWCKLETKEE